ncbi:MAG: hypothetical protein ACKO96_32015, partial [Flammeovirgaceae bacterium]
MKTVSVGELRVLPFPDQSVQFVPSAVERIYIPLSVPLTDWYKRLLKTVSVGELRVLPFPDQSVQFVPSAVERI